MYVFFFPMLCQKYSALLYAEGLRVLFLRVENKTKENKSLFSAKRCQLSTRGGATSRSVISPSSHRRLSQLVFHCPDKGAFKLRIAFSRNTVSNYANTYFECTSRA